jgi:hypothetical protein
VWDPVEEPTAARIRRLETQLGTVTDAVRTLARGLERPPYDRPGGDRSAVAARRAHELLMTAPMPLSDDSADT